MDARGEPLIFAARGECYGSQMTNFNLVVNGIVIVCSVVGFVGILFGAYLVLTALPELPRYIRIKRM